MKAHEISLLRATINLATNKQLLFPHVFTYAFGIIANIDSTPVKTVKRSKKVDAVNQSKADANQVNYRYWLMKSEPDSRMEHGVDVKV